MPKNSKCRPADKFTSLQGFFGALVLSFLAILCPSSCGTWAGNPKDPGEEPTSSGDDSKVTLDIQGVHAATNLLASAIEVIGKDGSKVGTITLSEARVVLKEIKIKSDDSDSKSRQKFPGPFVIDLLTNRSTPSIDTIALEAGVYRSVELILAKLEKGKSGNNIDASDPIIEKSVLLAGIFTPLSGLAMPFALSLEIDEKFQLKLAGNRSGIDISPDQINTLIIGFHLGNWFNFSGQEWDMTDVTHSTLAADLDGSSEAAKKVREYIKENIKESAEFARDKDHDGKITDEDDDEDKIAEREKR